MSTSEKQQLVYLSNTQTFYVAHQTGTGKTFTMDGAPGEGLQGITPRAFDQIFAEIEQSEGTQYLVRASFLEIYNEEIRDLLSKDPKARLEMHEDKDGAVYVKNLNTFVVKSTAEISSVLEVRSRSM